MLDVEAKTVVKREDFGMKKAFAGIGEKVNIQVSGQCRPNKSYWLFYR